MKLRFSQWWLKILTLVCNKINKNLVLIEEVYSVSSQIYAIHIISTFIKKCIKRIL